MDGCGRVLIILFSNKCTALVFMKKETSYQFEVNMEIAVKPNLPVKKTELFKAFDMQNQAIQKNTAENQNAALIYKNKQARKKANNLTGLKLLVGVVGVFLSIKTISSLIKKNQIKKLVAELDALKIKLEEIAQKLESKQLEFKMDNLVPSQLKTTLQEFIEEWSLIKQELTELRKELNADPQNKLNLENKKNACLEKYKEPLALTKKQKRLKKEIQELEAKEKELLNRKAELESKIESKKDALKSNHPEKNRDEYNDYWDDWYDNDWGDEDFFTHNYLDD
jgi:hypothetical protein